MRTLVQKVTRLAVWGQRHGQDLVEYALMAAFVATTAAVLMPNAATHISQLFSKAGSVLTKANGS
jgi:Flp pilus assembly pilin Flp